MVTVSVDGSVLDRIAKIISLLRLGSSGKVLKKKKKEREVKASAALSCLVLFAGLRHLDPNREASKKAPRKLSNTRRKLRNA
ncbi:hypothetical protein U1Q18_032910 [Sarracenia purpurea var. burkii]